MLRQRIYFFEEARAHLAADGVFLQWLQLYKIDRETLRLLARTFRRSFPRVYCVRPPATGDLILLGTAAPPDLTRLVEDPPGPLELTAGMEEPLDYLAVFLGGAAGLDRWVGLGPELPVNTDGRSEALFRVARSLDAPAGTARSNLRALRRALGRDPVSRSLPEAWRRPERLRRLARRNLRLGDFEEALADIEGDNSAAAAALREEIRREQGGGGG